ncbi:MAG: TolC family protein [Endomicrobium sp.]|jgi:outer membrane protein TolC|nr:TolC family protein [Endomicrobium sp.]
MKKIIFLFILFFIAKLTLFAEIYERVLTEKASIESAFSINPDILEYTQDLEYAKQRVKEASSLYLPVVGVNLNLSSFNNSKPIIISEQNYQVLTYLPDGKKDLYYSTKLTIWQSLYTGGITRTTNKLARVNLNKVKNEENIIKSKIINNIKTIFNECLYHKALISLYDMKSEIANNTVLKNKKDVETLKYKQEILRLLNAIGLDLNTIASISGNLDPKIKKIDLEKCLLLAYQFKPEFKATQEQQTLDDLMLNLLSMQRYPNISVGAAREWLGDRIDRIDRIFGDGDNWYCTLNVNLPIFDGGSLFARIKQGNIKYREATIKRAKLENDIKLAIAQTFLEYSFFRQQVINAKLLEKNGRYNESDIELIRDLNRSYYNLELAVGVEFDSY